MKDQRMRKEDTATDLLSPILNVVVIDPAGQTIADTFTPEVKGRIAVTVRSLEETWGKLTGR